MTSEHYDDDALTLHLSDPSDAIAQHVDSCDTCAQRLAFVREFEHALADSATWTGVDVLMQPFAAPAAVVAEAHAVADEDHSAAEMLGPALVSIGAFREQEVETRDRYRSAGVVRVLTREAKRVRDASPQFALLLATTAVSIAAKLPGRGVRACVLGAAWLERGIASAMLGKYRDAEAALRRAEDVLDGDGGTTWDLATVWLSRANVYTETDRLDEALELAFRSANVFLLEYGDVARYLRASLVRGTVLYVRQMYRESIAIFDEMLSYAQEIEDVVTQARALHNAANCYLAMDDLDRASEYYCRALPLWDEAGADAEIARTRWSLATIDVRRGDWATGYAGLEDARRQLSALGIQNDEALVRLEIAELLIVLRRRHEVPALLEGIVVRFSSEGMMRNARLALASLSEARRAIPVTAQEVRHVREYLGRLPTQPSEPFVPLK